MATLSTTAWVLHDLGLAAGFGGNLFGQLAMHPALAAIGEKRERGKVAHEAWSRYKVVNALSLGAMAGTWIAGRSFLSGREVGPASRNLVLLKDILVGGAVLGGGIAIVAGAMLDKEQAGGGQPIETGSKPAPETPKRVATLQTITNVAGTASLVFNAAVLAVTTVLAMKAGKSKKWAFFSELLP
jgi:hypothetical protein